MLFIEPCSLFISIWEFKKKPYEWACKMRLASSKSTDLNSWRKKNTYQISIYNELLQSPGPWQKASPTQDKRSRQAYPQEILGLRFRMSTSTNLLAFPLFHGLTDSPMVVWHSGEEEVQFSLLKVKTNLLFWVLSAEGSTFFLHNIIILTITMKRLSIRPQFILERGHIWWSLWEVCWVPKWIWLLWKMNFFQ